MTLHPDTEVYDTQTLTTHPKQKAPGFSSTLPTLPQQILSPGILVPSSQWTVMELWTCEKVLASSSSQLPTAHPSHGSHMHFVAAAPYHSLRPQGPTSCRNVPSSTECLFCLLKLSEYILFFCSNSSNMLNSCSVQLCFSELPQGASCPFSSSAYHTFVNLLTPATKLRSLLPSSHS